jgi:hypothetical protein
MEGLTMEMNYTDRYYARLFNRDNPDVTRDKDQLLSLAALLIDLQQDKWLDEIKIRFKDEE